MSGASNLLASTKTIKLRLEDVATGRNTPKQTSSTAPSAPNSTLKMAVRIPKGISSLAHDSSLGSKPAQYFTACFTSATRKNADESQRLRIDPEDRAFVFRMPILQTAYNTTQDKARLLKVAA